MEGKAKVALTFALYQGDQLVRRETVTQDIVKVGKDPKSHLRVDDELASRMHAVIEVASPDDITLIDLGNEPGTMVNGAARQQVQDSARAIRFRSAARMIVLESAEPRRRCGRRRAPPPVARRRTRARLRAARRRGAARSRAAAAAPPQSVRVRHAARCAANPFAAAAARSVRASRTRSRAAADRRRRRSPTTRPRARTRTRSMKSGPDVHPDEVEIGTPRRSK